MPVHVHQAFIGPFFSVWQTNEILPRLPVLRPQQQFPSGDYATDGSRQRSSAAAGSPAAEQVSSLADASAFHKPLTV